MARMTAEKQSNHNKHHSGGGQGGGGGGERKHHHHHHHHHRDTAGHQDSTQIDIRSGYPYKTGRDRDRWDPKVGKAFNLIQ